MRITFNFSKIDNGYSAVFIVNLKDNLSAFDYYRKLTSSHYRLIILYEETIVLAAWYAYGKTANII